MIIGAADPLEGSVVILTGSALITLTIYINKDRHLKIFMISFLMILIGVISLFSLSSLGGVGGNSYLSWWWGLLMLPYPIGWLFSIALLIIRALQKKEKAMS